MQSKYVVFCKLYYFKIEVVNEDYFMPLNVILLYQGITTHGL